LYDTLAGTVASVVWSVRVTVDPEIVAAFIASLNVAVGL
jgi:hypothetical protein